MKRRAFRLICSAVLLAALALNGLTAGAAGSVTYDGCAQSFICRWSRTIPSRRRPATATAFRFGACCCSRARCWRYSSL